MNRGIPPYAHTSDRTVHDVQCIARLKHGVSLSQADAAMNAIQENIDRLDPETERGLGAKVLPAKEALVGDVRGTLLLLLGAVGVAADRLRQCGEPFTRAFGKA
jgi:hypothetical protein